MSSALSLSIHTTSSFFMQSMRPVAAFSQAKFQPSLNALSSAASDGCGACGGDRGGCVGCGGGFGLEGRGSGCFVLQRRVGTVEGGGFGGIGCGGGGSGGGGCGGNGGFGGVGCNGGSGGGFGFGAGFSCFHFREGVVPVVPAVPAAPAAPASPAGCTAGAAAAAGFDAAGRFKAVGAVAGAAADADAEAVHPQTQCRQTCPLHKVHCRQWVGQKG